MTKRAALYVRVSKNRDDDAAKPDRQIESCMHLIAARGYDLAFEPFVDDDVSAYRDKTKRPQYEALWARIKAGEVDVVITWNIDRLLRTTKEMLAFIELAERTGVSLDGVQGGNLDLSTPSGRMVAVILSAVAAQEVELKSERHILKNQQSRALGKSTGGPVPFGWTLGEGGTFLLDDLQAAQLREATEHILQGTRSLSGIAKEWNSKGITTTFGKAWTHTAVKKVLSRARNCGLVEHDGKVLEGVKAAHEAVVTREQWLACKDILSSRSRPRAARKHLLSNLLTCDRCGRPMTAGIATQIVRGKRYEYAVYRHFPQDRGCGATVRQAMADDRVFRHVRYLLTFHDIEALAPTDVDLTRAAALRQESASVDVKMRELEEMWSAGEFSTEGYRKQRGILAEAQEGLSEALADIERSNAFASLLVSSMGNASFTQSANVGQRFEALTLEHRRVIIKTLFPRIEVHPGKGESRVKTFRPDGDEFAFDAEDVA